VSSDKEKYILAIDLATSSTKAALVSLDGRAVAMESEENKLILLPQGGAEQDPQQWWRAVKNTCRRLLDRKLVSADDIIAVSCTGQWSGTVAVDRDGCALTNAMTWMDSRGRPYVNAITRGRINIRGYDVAKLWRWIRLTGGAPCHSGKCPISHILYMKHACPDIYRQAHKFLEPKDYINFKLTGRYAASYDSIALHWVTDNRHLSKVVYDQRLIEMATIDPDKLPELKRAVDVLGPLTEDAAQALGLNRDTCVIVGTPDVQSAALGSGAIQDFAPHLCLGTSSWLTCHVPFKKTGLRHNLASLPSAIPDRYFIGNEQETAGACLGFVKNILGSKDMRSSGSCPSDVWAALDETAAQVAPGSNRVIFTPWLYGERTPVEDALVRASFFNLSLQTKREDLIRAVYEGVAYNSRWLLECVERFARRRLDNIRMIGGGARSDLWCQIYADVLGRNIEQVKDPVEANLRGAALLASVALGRLTFDDIPERVEIAARYEPRVENRRTYDRLFRAFKAIYTSNRAVYAELNGSGQGKH
jgi:xylulokinase